MSDEQVQKSEQPTAAFVLSLLAGLWMLAAGSMMGGFGRGGMMGGWMGSGRGMGRGMGGWMGGRMSGWMYGHGTGSFGVIWPWFGILAGIAVLIGAVMLYTNPRQRRGWGALVLVASALNFFVGMGGLLAGVLGVIGGALALSGK